MEKEMETEMETEMGKTWEKHGKQVHRFLLISNLNQKFSY